LAGQNDKIIEIAGVDSVKSSEAVLRKEKVEVPEDSR
jgi:hypothetical protein